MKIKDIKVNDCIHVIENKSLILNLYEVYRIYENKSGLRVFECSKMMFNENGEKRLCDEPPALIHECKVVGVYKEIEWV